MRKFSYTMLGGVLVVIALTSSLAFGKTAPRAYPSLVRCGTLYTKPCTGPGIVVRPPSPACKAAGKILTLAAIKLSDDGGISSVTVKFGKKTIKSVTYSGAPVNKTVRGLKLSTSGLRSGVVYTITIKLVDTRGKTTTKTLHFTICAPKPIFTG